MSVFQRTISSVSFYPVTAVYCAGLIVVQAVSFGWIEIGSGLVALTIIAIIVVLVATLREVRVVHNLVNSHRDILIARIDQLEESMQEQGSTVPPSPKGSP